MILDSTRSRRQTNRRILFTALGLGAAALVTFASLRPAANAHAQTAVALSGKPPPSVPVALAGVTDEKALVRKWWSASGVSLSKPPFESAFAHPLTVVGAKGMRSLMFAFRLPPDAHDVTTVLDAPDSVVSSSAGQWLGKMQSQANFSEAMLNRDTGGMRTLEAIYPVSSAKASLRVGIASGPWITSVHYLPPVPDVGASNMSPDGTFLFSPIAETKEGEVLTLATDTITAYGKRSDLRIVAVDTQGHECLPLSIGDNSINRLDQITARFALPLAQIKDFRVQIRPFVWTEFKNVALQPSGNPAEPVDTPTKETAKTSLSSPVVPVLFSAAPEAATARRLQQICVLIQIYRTTHGSAYPATFGANSLLADIAAHPQAYGPNQGADKMALAIPYFTKPGSPIIAYFLHNKRPDGTLVGTAKLAGTRDVLAYTNLYIHNHPHGATGFYLVLWDDGMVSKIPASQALAIPVYDVIGPTGATEEAARQGEKQIAFPGQAGLPRS